MPRDPRISYGTAAIIRHPEDIDRVLLLQRAGAHAAGSWSMPGGWCDYGELSSNAVLREVLEEVGLFAERPRFVTFREEQHERGEDHFQSLTLYYEVVVPRGRPEIMEPHKCTALRWVNLRDPDTWPEPLFPKLESVLEVLAQELRDGRWPGR